MTDDGGGLPAASWRCFSCVGRDADLTCWPLRRYDGGCGGCGRPDPPVLLARARVDTCAGHVAPRAAQEHTDQCYVHELLQAAQEREGVETAAGDCRHGGPEGAVDEYFAEMPGPRATVDEGHDGTAGPGCTVDGVMATSSVQEALLAQPALCSRVMAA